MASLYVGFFLLLIALVLLLVSSSQRRAAGLPSGRVVYSDTRGWKKLERALYNAELGLAGRPDYLVEKGGMLIPVEVKSGRTPEAPYDAHIFQVAAYCLLVEKTYARRPAYGLIHYTGRTFAVDYTPALESALLDLLAGIRRDEPRSQVDRSHEQAGRCQHCGFQRACDQRLD